MTVAKDFFETFEVGEYALLAKEDAPDFVAHLCRKGQVFAPVADDGGTVFGHIDPDVNLDLLRLDYQTTRLPPKKLLHRPFQEIFSFSGGEVEGAGEEAEQLKVLFGVHPCDVHGIRILDQVFVESDEYDDPHYEKERKNNAIVALNCNTVGENCFCHSWGTGPFLEDADEHHDLLLTDLGDEYLVEINTRLGLELLEGAEMAPAARVKKMEKQRAYKEVVGKFEKEMKTDDLDELLADEDAFNHPVWQEKMDECLACGSCTMVCPTCFCYDVYDQLGLDLESGSRNREWMSCMLLEFAEVALDHNFRPDRDNRIKHRIYHKLIYYDPQFSTLGCVGCGRCIDTCIKDIDPTEIVRSIREDGETE